MPATNVTETLRTQACWYAWGYNDHRAQGAPYVDVFDFGDYVAERSRSSHRPSIQAMFEEFVRIRLVSASTAVESQS